MSFFSKFPVKLYDTVVLTDITTRLNYIEFNWINNPLLYYDYKYDDRDTLDGIADRYYNDPNMYWIILVTNGILNPVFDMPLNEKNFNKYINQKYKTQGSALNISGLQYALQTNDPIYAYQKLVTIKNLDINRVVSSDYFILDETSYNNVAEYMTEFTKDGTKYSYTISRNSIKSIYDREYEENEKKRDIKILKEQYVPEINKTFNNLISKLPNGY